jgi:ferritin-like metal-binding protein YciE
VPAGNGFDNGYTIPSADGHRLPARAFALQRKGISMELTDLKALYVEELKDLYSAENQLVEALPKMAKAANEPALKKSFERHLEQTQGHVTRLETIFDNLDVKPNGKVCKAMKGLVAEGAEMIEEEAAPAVKDAGLIAAAQRVEHYEIAGYGCVRTYAQELGDTAAVKLLQATLDEEAATDESLSKLAERVVNLKAKAA